MSFSIDIYLSTGTLLEYFFKWEERKLTSYKLEKNVTGKKSTLE